MDLTGRCCVGVDLLAGGTIGVRERLGEGWGVDLLGGCTGRCSVGVRCHRFTLGR